MLKQKEFELILSDLKQNNMEGYEEWFNENINCKIKYETTGKWLNGIRLYSTSKNHAIIVIEGFNGVVFRVDLDRFIVINK